MSTPSCAHLVLVAIPPDLLVGAVGDTAPLVLPAVDAVAEADVGPGVHGADRQGPAFEAVGPAGRVNQLQLLADGAVQDRVVLEDIAAHGRRSSRPGRSRPGG